MFNHNFQVDLDGLTGKVKFDQFGLRTDFQLEIVELKKKGLQKVKEFKNPCIFTLIFVFKVGTWHDQFGINFSRNITQSLTEVVESLENKTLVVTTIMVRDGEGKIAEVTLLISVPTIQHV